MTTYAHTLKTPAEYAAINAALDARFAASGPVRNILARSVSDPETPKAPRANSPWEKSNTKPHEAVFRFDPGMKRQQGEKVISPRNYGKDDCVICTENFQKFTFNQTTCCDYCRSELRRRTQREICKDCGATRNAELDA